MPLRQTLVRFARSECGAFTLDWILQAALVGAICMGVLTSVSTTENYHTRVETDHSGHMATIQYP